MMYPIQSVVQLRPLLIGLRKRSGQSRAAMAALFGVTQQNYAKIEANPAAVSVERLFTILRLLGCEIVVSEKSPLAAVAPSTAKKRNKGKVVAPAKVLPLSKKNEDW